MELPVWILSLLERFESRGFEAYAVGGCVRDSLLQKTPLDYDLAASALPEETDALFAELPVYKTGIKHGTVTVLSQDHPVEITTFRREAGYSDRRHPDEVRFTQSIAEDLCRRDFTVNAMAYHPRKGLIDPWSGREDLRNGILRCVGEPGRRFREDALRMLRALRFAAVLGFTLEAETRKALLENRELLKQVSAPRIQAEFDKLVRADGADEVLKGYPEVFKLFLPEIYPLAAELSPYAAESPLRLGLLLSNCTASEAEAAVRRLRYDHKTAALVKALEENRMLPPPRTRIEARLLAKRLGLPLAVKLMAFLNDTQGKELLRQIERQNLCCSVGRLAVNGEDLLRLGIPPGKQVGEALTRLLELVITEELPNEREALLMAVQRDIKPFQ